jgi:deazaflavin-dependent oxidoreductase (nitroreductase family)
MIKPSFVIPRSLISRIHRPEPDDATSKTGIAAAAPVPHDRAHTRAPKASEVNPMAEQQESPKLPDWIQDHLKRYIASDGADGYLWDASLGGGKGMIPTLLLTTVGRKSGRELTMPLIFGRSGDDYVVVASKGGAPAHPAWYLNLEASQAVRIQVKADKFAARARTAQGPERDALWKKMVAIYAPYELYQTKTDRQIPVVVLERT